ncbi:MAG: acyl-ACP--UDP-N-acetylglucosamine O-acyltransferase [Chthoniobacterales bacterium]
MKIHPSAIIDPTARIAEDVEIGPYSSVAAGATIESGCVLQSHVVIEGTVRLGQNNTIGHGAVIGAPPQDLNFSRETVSDVAIGSDNVIREYCTIHRGTLAQSSTVIGNGNFLMVGAHVGHNCAIGNGVIIANNCLLGGNVSVGDRAFIGGGTTLHQNTHVGRLAIAQGSSAFSKDLPPFVLAAERNTVFGLNVIGLRRAGFSAAQRAEIKAAFKLLYTSGLNTRQALEKAATTEFSDAGREFFDFVAGAQERGICAFGRTSRPG